MPARSLYRVLVPDAPLHRRTEVDEPRGPRSRAAAGREVVPGLQAPRLVSSYEGSIDRILFCFPSWAERDLRLVAGYRSVLEALRPGTRFIAVHNESAGPAVEAWFDRSGHPAANVEYVPVPDYVAVTDWAEDAYVAVKDGADGTSYLMEPWEFGRVGDAMIADAVEEHCDLKASGSPLIFQGGNSLVGGDFWFLGKDYFADTVALFSEDASPVSVPPGQSPDSLARRLFADYVESTRRLVLIGTRKPIALREYVGSRAGSDFYLDLAASGAGTFQPIFHIDMFVTLVGPNAAGDFEVLVGDPTQGDELLARTAPFSLAPVYDRIAADLSGAGFAVRRNPLVHWPTLGQSLTLGRLKELSREPDGEALVPAVAELKAAGAKDTTRVRVRDWHHITWNNCLVENSATVGRHVYLPTFGHGPMASLAAVDDHMTALWDELGFTVHLLGDFNPFARRLGVVHCIKKYVDRGG
ncbi:MAG: hypothetical protein ACRD0N_16205 [Acidimicrobiales bacterium]